jgi:outer membrane protein OmpA-like peptidoglycan-associated protein
VKEHDVQKKLCRFIFVFTLFLLGGCSSNKYFHSENCNALIYQYNLGETLKSQGIKVIIVGDEVTLFLPAYRFFYTNSNHIRHQRKLFNQIIAYMNTYPITNVEVKGYTENTGDYTRNLALSRAQAEAIAYYLQQNGLNVRLIASEGYGCHTYGLNTIEIFFRKPPPDNVFH